MEIRHRLSKLHTLRYRFFRPPTRRRTSFSLDHVHSVGQGANSPPMRLTCIVHRASSCQLAKRDEFFCINPFPSKTNAFSSSVATWQGTARQHTHVGGCTRGNYVSRICVLPKQPIMILQAPRGCPNRIPIVSQGIQQIDSITSYRVPC